MSKWLPEKQNEELWSLVEGLYVGTLTIMQRDHLEELIAESEDVATFCAVYADMHAMLRWRFRPIKPDEPIISDRLLSMDTSAPAEIVPDSTFQPLTQDDRFLPAFPSAILDRPLSSLFSGWPVAYLIATVIFGIGAVIGSITYVSRPVQIAERLPTVTKGPSMPEPQTEFIGRITSMVDCKWAGADRLSRNVSLGSKYTLDSGLLEITYNTGAKVILQGPVTYEVNSGNSGYLSIGKLTAKINSLKPRTANSASPLFSVRTPTAVITDLGTEFGVEVDRDGTNRVRVFQGRVEVDRTAIAGQIEPIRLAAGESICLNQAGLVIDDNTALNGSTEFIRQVPIQDTPDKLAGLKMWLRADTGLFKDATGKTPAMLGDKVALWVDQSLNYHNATQSDLKACPTLVVGSLGRPVVRFDGVDDVLKLDELEFSAGCTVIALAGNHGDHGFFVLLGQHCGDVIAPCWSEHSRLVYDEATDKSIKSDVPDFRDSSYRIFSVCKFADGGNHAVTWHTNGLRDSLPTSDTLSSEHVLNFNEIGARTNADNPTSEPGQFGRQDIVELLVFDRALSHAERQTVETYLKQKYKLSNNVNP